MSRNFELLRQAGDFSRRDVFNPPMPGSGQLAPRNGNHAHAVAEDKVSDFMRALDVLRRHWRLSALFAAVVMLTAVGITFLIKPTYEPVVSIEVDPPGEAFSLQGGDSSPSDGEYLETQAQNLKNNSLAVDVTRKLHLEQYPEFAGEAARQTAGAASAASDSPQLTAAENAAFESLKARLKVRRDTASRLILVSFSSHDPQLAALVANTVAQTFIEDTFETRHKAIMRSSEWLSRQLDDIREKMENSSRALAEFQGETGVEDLDPEKNTYSEHMSELSQQLTQAEAERIQLQALLANVQNSSPDSLPEVRNNPVVQQLSQKLAELRAELSQTLVVYGKNHPMAKRLQSQCDELQSELDSQKRAIVNSLKASYAAAEARERLMAAEMKGTTKQIDQMARYAALKKEVQTEVDLYNSLYARIKEAGIAAASKSGNIRVVDEARVLTEPTSPQRMLNIAVGLLVALVGGVLVAFVREDLDNRLRTPEDLTKWIGTSNVAIIPMIANANGGRKSSALPLPTGKNGGGMRGAAFILERPNSPEAEALHSLQASIMLARPDVPPQILLVASSFPGEGKTTVALNLALSLAQQGETCLVDADLRKGEVSSRFGLQPTFGFADYLSGNTTVKEILLPIAGVHNLTVVPAGVPRTNPGQLLCSPGAQALFQELRQRFRFVVVDSVPILPFADGRALSPIVDALVFVGRAGVTTREAMRRSMQLLAEVHAAPILEFVLNAADISSSAYNYYRYGYAAYHDAHSA